MPLITPHDARPSHHTMLDPHVWIPPQVAEDLSQLSRHTTSEVGFMGLVEHDRIIDDNALLIADNYTITEIMLLDQECHSSTTELSAAALAALGGELMQRGNDDYDKLLFWGHTHPFGSTAPSGQDEQQMTLFRRNGCPWFLRGIFAPKRSEYTLFNFESYNVVRDVPWSIKLNVEDRSEYWKAQLAAKVHSIQYAGFHKGSRQKGGKDKDNGKDNGKDFGPDSASNANLFRSHADDFEVVD